MLRSLRCRLTDWFYLAPVFSCERVIQTFSIVMLLLICQCSSNGSSVDLSVSPTASSVISASANSQQAPVDPPIKAVADSSASSSQTRESPASPNLSSMPPAMRTIDPKKGPHVIVAPVVPEGQGDIADMQNISSTLDDIQPVLNDCYRRSLTKNSKLDGSIGFRVSVGDAGVSVKKAGGSIQDEELVHCLSKAIEKAPYPKVRARLAILVPMKLQP